ncbi:Nibrin [Liparis tanakae]|uniref:Nibrin n=1 Tax=Liparis tanakae TaxID=230148 RepID=A0A4Z2IDU0_9TELE|nr:Nibrin [Liparis tanakae]
MAVRWMSISRAHAHLTAADQTLTLKDTSKYGSFVNSQQLTPNTPVNLKSGDNVTFGVFNSKFSVDHQKPVVCSSCLDNEGKASLSQALSALGGKLINTWTHECTHLAMPSMKVTIKTISALLCCCPIVKPEFFMEFSKAAQQKLPPPKAERYRTIHTDTMSGHTGTSASFVPEIDEPSLSKEDVNLGAIPVRKQLFSGKTFIFLNAKQLKRLSRAVDFGGGKSQLLEGGALPRGLLESPQSCVVNVMTDSSQTLLPPSTTEWANSVKDIVQRKGLRVITESEIGLAAIYASCVKYCNPSNLTPDSELAPKVQPRIPGASLSQSVAVEETVLPAASQNITAYAVNTEPSQGTELCEGTGLMAVGETPERKRNQNRSQLLGSKHVAMETTTQYIVADTMSSSFNTVENTDSQRKKPTGAGSGGMKSQPALPRTKLSPQKRKLSAQASPQKQSTLTTFFQTANKKRPLEEESLSFMSEPKRPALDTDAKQTPNTSARSKEASSSSDRAPVAISQTTLGSTADLFVGRSEAQPNRVSHAVHEEPCSRKRKEMEAEIQMDELEELMSEDMDFLDEQPSGNQGQQAQLETLKSTEHKQSLNTVAASSSSKRPRVQLEEHVKNQKPQVGLGKEKKQTSGQHIVTIKTEQVDPVEYKTTNKGSSTRPEVSSASTSKDIQPFEDGDSSFIEDVELLKVDMCQPKEDTKNPLQPVALKLEVQESTIDEDLPKKLVLVEFRSLTVTVPPKTKPQRMQNNTKNFKCFRKICVPGVEGIIRGSDLLVHSRGKNTDLDEWLKDAVEDERQSKRDQSIGEDLFRYNPSKLTRRR